MPLTRANLWFLYRFLDMTKAEVVNVTGWTRGQIDHGIRKWDLGNWSATAFDTARAIKEHIARVRGLSILTDHDKVSGLADAEIARLRELVRSGAFSWDEGHGERIRRHPTRTPSRRLEGSGARACA